MTDLELFCKALDGEWVVDHYELDDDRLRVHYRSLEVTGMLWSHLPFGGLENVAPVGTVGRVGFIGNKKE